jgi:hypothetical protein
VPKDNHLIKNNLKVVEVPGFEPTRATLAKSLENAELING